MDTFIKLRIGYILDYLQKELKNNPNKHSKTVVESMNYNELAVRNRPQKHRYVYFIGSKKEKKEMFNDLKYEIKPYPKGKNIRYDASYKPIIQRELFTTI